MGEVTMESFMINKYSSSTMQNLKYCSLLALFTQRVYNMATMEKHDNNNHVPSLLCADDLTLCSEGK